jgi:hypothetical protein
MNVHIHCVSVTKISQFMLCSQMNAIAVYIVLCVQNADFLMIKYKVDNSYHY